MTSLDRMKMLDRSIQKDLLFAMGNAYPDALSPEKIFPLFDASAMRVNLSYLSEHGLAKVDIVYYTDGSWLLRSATITARGLDFLADDGGLSAILGVQTFRLHEDSIRQLLIAKVEDSDADETVKGKLIDQLKSLPAEGIGRLAEKAVDAGIQALPNAIHWLQQCL